MSELWVGRLGTVDYREAHELQERLRAARQDGRIPDVLLLLEHPPVYTRAGDRRPAELPLGEDWYAEQGIDDRRHRPRRQLTYHGPGQLVAIRSSRSGDVLPFVRTLERAIVAALADEGVQAHARDDEAAAFVGVWVEDRKIASLGIRVKGGITKHGLAINVENDLAPFGWAVACGLPGVTITSVERRRRRCAATPWAACARTSRTASRRSSGCASGSCRPARLVRALDTSSIPA